MKKRFVGLAVLAALAVGAEAQNKGNIKIVSQTPLSGSSSNLGIAIRNGVELAMDDFGKLVRAYGFKFTYEPLDDRGDKEVGTANANRLINDPDILGVVGHLNSSVAVPSSEVYARVNLTMVSPANTAEAVTDRNSTSKITNRVCGRDDVQGPAGADFVVNTLKAKKVYIINDKTTYGEGLARAFTERLKGLGITPAFETGIESKELDFSTFLNRAAADKPEVIYFAGLYGQVGPFIKQARTKGVTAAIVGGDGYDSSDLQKLAGAENMKNVYFTTTSAPISSLPAAKRFADRYKAKFKVSPEGYSAYGYDAARVVIQGIADATRAAKGAKPTREAVAKAVRGVKFAGVTGNVSFNERGDLPLATYVIVAAAPDPNNNKVTKLVKVAAPTPPMK
jgi:branched-chain amino acid transport system substrate-binding protein